MMRSDEVKRDAVAQIIKQGYPVREVGVGDLEPHQVAAVQLAVDDKVEKCQVVVAFGDLKTAASSAR